jgi:hypothetical protein
MMSESGRAITLSSHLPSETRQAEDRLLALPVDQLVTRIRALEARLGRYERAAALSNALMSLKPAETHRAGRPVDPDLPGRQIAWALASAPGGSIDRWIAANGIDMRPVGRVRDSAHSRIRTFVFASAEKQEQMTGAVVSVGRLEQTVTRLNNYAKAGRALLKFRSE